MGLQMGSCDAYVNIAGGIRIQEPAIDLGIVMALVSSFQNKCIDDKMIAFGEVGLSGEVRGVNMVQARVQEASKLGFTSCIVPKVCLDSLKDVSGIKVIGVGSVSDAIDLL